MAKTGRRIRIPEGNGGPGPLEGSGGQSRHPNFSKREKKRAPFGKAVKNTKTQNYQGEQREIPWHNLRGRGGQKEKTETQRAGHRVRKTPKKYHSAHHIKRATTGGGLKPTQKSRPPQGKFKRGGLPRKRERPKSTIKVLHQES